MTRKILINGRREEELRVAIVENQTLEDFEIETKKSGLLRNNIYRGVVTNIAPSLNAAFVDFGESRNGFLAFNDVVESAYLKHGKDINRITDVLAVGQELIVQVIKDAGGLKGAQVTTNISIAGRYLVLRPKDAKSGVSRKVDDDARADLTQKIRSLDLPEGYGCIVRTNAMDQPRAILLRDAKVLIQLWHKIEAEFAKGKGPQLLYNDQDIVVQAMRDYFDSTINEVLIDDKSCFERAKTYVKATFESGEDKLKFYEDKMPLFTRYGIEKQIEQIYARTVWLPSGGFIVIDPTEALTAIDVNSAHSTKRETQDLTAYHTNLEAAVEIARQLRMRDIGGLIVIDFIDMRQGKHQRDVERVMRNAMARDKARSKVERISANGLLEINRQRLSQALTMRTHLECPTCGGRGFIPSADAIGMTLIREIDARAANGELGGVVIKLHPEIAQKLQNERRREFAQLELDYNIRIEIIGSHDISKGDESIEWLTKRQETELHPERFNAPQQEAASIIDVAEAYQSNEPDDAYRPNDFEEFSSEEARKKRAAKRAAHKENREAAKSAERAEKAAENAEAAKPAEAAKSAPAKDEKITNARCATGLAVLSVLIEKMKNHMNDDNARSEGRSRKFSFRSRRHGSRNESNGIQSDARMFVLDLLKAACVLSCGASTDITRREMLDRMIEVSDSLMNAARMGTESAAQYANALRNLVASRHAVARIVSLFDASGNTQPDELTKALLSDRKEAFGNSEKIDDKSIAKLTQCLTARCQNIFSAAQEPAKQAETPESFDKSAIIEAIEGLNDADFEEMFNEASIPAAKEQPKAETPIDAAARAMERRHRRTHTRRSMGDDSSVSPYAGENAEIITSDVRIAPMTPLNDTDAPIRYDSPEDIGQAITQELPAVESLRRVRRTRRTRENAEQPVSVESANAQPMAAIEPVQAKPAETMQIQPAATESAESMRRVRKTRRNGMMNESAEQLNAVTETVQPVAAAAPAAVPAPVPAAVPANASRVETRRVRRTRRTDRGDVLAQEVTAPTAIDTVSEKAETEPVHEIVSAPAVHDFASEQPRSRERAPRRTRQNRAPIEPIAEEIKPIKETASVAELKDTPRLEISAIDMIKDAAVEEARSTRRVRKTRPAKVAASSEAKDSVAREIAEAEIQAAVIESFGESAKDFNSAAAEFQATAQKLKAAEQPKAEILESISDSANAFQAAAMEFQVTAESFRAPETESKSTRRVRKTRKASAETEQVQTQNPVHAAEPVVKQDIVQEMPKETASEQETTDRTRTRRTRRTRPNE